MWRYILRRLLQAIPVALGVTVLVFFLIHLVPGDPARTILGNRATVERVALLRHEWGLDRPLPVQYGKFMGRLVPGDLGTKGGLRTDARARVLREDGSTVPGLYAAGNASAAVMGSTYAGAGATIGPAMTFGYVAALDLVAEAEN